MSESSDDFTISIHPPPGPDTTLTLPTPSNPSPANPQILTDALTIRQKVFVEEQHCSAATEIDEDDPRSWHWVIYHRRQDADRKQVPVAVIRLVPPPQSPHELLTVAGPSPLPKYDLAREPCVKLTRVAVLKEYRGRGLGRRLVEEALGWARAHACEIEEVYSRTCRENGAGDKVQRWKGLVLVHAQVQGEKMYERFGFVRDEAMGRWDEEGIEHVGMWKRIDLDG